MLIQLLNFLKLFVFTRENLYQDLTQYVWLTTDIKGRQDYCLSGEESCVLPAASQLITLKLSFQDRKNCYG